MGYLLNVGKYILTEFRAELADRDVRRTLSPNSQLSYSEAVGLSERRDCLRQKAEKLREELDW